MITVEQFDFKDRKALIRVDFNVPLNEHLIITDDSRMVAALPSIKKVLNDGGSVILMSHLGRPKTGPEDRFSLKHLVSHLSELLACHVNFADDCVGESAVQKASELKNGEVLLLENLRFYAEETKGDEAFASKLAALGDIYVNDAFGTAHRAHASTAIIASFFQGRKCFGYLMAAEVENASKVMNEPQKPFTAIVGGAKVSDKMLIVENLLNVADNIIIGGGMAYTFFKAMGGEIGNSLLEEDRIALCKELIEKAKQKGVQLYLPTDSVVADEFNANAKTEVSLSNQIGEGWMGLDIGPEAVEEYRAVINASGTILWNGPMGVFEMEKFQNGTQSVALSVAEATEKGAFSLIGGGDSAAAIHKFGLAEKVSYVSTGGGALLEYFEGKTLPGIAAIEE